MSDPYLPPEILDCIVDLLRDDPEVLKECCLASRSWIPRTRKHLFTCLTFRTRTVKLWKMAFPDPSASPACYAEALFIACPHVLIAAGPEADSWFREFSRVVHLEVSLPPICQLATFLTPLHGLSPTVRSLHMKFDTLLLPSQMFDLILSFPLLKDLAMINYEGRPLANNDDGSYGLLTVDQPSSSPMFTGSLELRVRKEVEPIGRELLSLPGGLYFRKFNMTWFHEEDISLTTALVEECSHALESLEITCDLHRTSISASVCPHQ